MVLLCMRQGIQVLLFIASCHQLVLSPESKKTPVGVMHLISSYLEPLMEALSLLWKI